MKKALRTVFLGLFVIPVLTTTTASANDGKEGKKNTPPVSGHQDHDIRVNISKNGEEKSWWGDRWADIKDFFNHHDDKDKGDKDRDDKDKDHHEPGESSEPGGSTGSTEPGGSTPGGSPAPGSGTPGSPSVPIDGGISLLLAAGIGLGVKKARDRYIVKKEA